MTDVLLSFTAFNNILVLRVPCYIWILDIIKEMFLYSTVIDGILSQIIYVLAFFKRALSLQSKRKVTRYLL